MKYINHPELIQEWKLNIDASAYEKQIGANVYKPSDKADGGREEPRTYRMAFPTRAGPRP